MPSFEEMAFSLMQSGIPYEKVFCEMSLLEVQYLFGVGLRVELRGVLQSSTILISSFAAFFQKKNEETFAEMVANQIRTLGASLNLLPIDLDAGIGQGEEHRQQEDVFDKLWSQVARMQQTRGL